MTYLAVLLYPFVYKAKTALHIRIANTFLRFCIINIEKCWRKINKEEFVEVLSFAYIFIQLSRGECWDPINWFDTVTLLFLSHQSTSSANVICGGLFLCSMNLGERKSLTITV